MAKFFNTLPQFVEYICKNFNREACLGYKHNGDWIKISTEEFGVQVKSLAAGLRELGFEKSDRMGIMAHPSPFWIIMDQAVQYLGGVSVPLFPNVSEANLEYELDESETKWVFLSDISQWEYLKNFEGKFKKVLFQSGKLDLEKMTTLAEVQKLGEDPDKIKAVEKSGMEVKSEDLATIIYTSGSTGVPKGVEINHSNLVSQMEAAGIRFPIDPEEDRCLSALPLAHVFERMVTMYYMSMGVDLYFAEEVKKVGDNLRELSPTVITLVPRLLEKVFAKMQGNVEEATGIKKVLGAAALQRAISRENSSPAGFMDKLYDKLVYSKMRAALGGNLRIAISGSAPLAPSLYNFFLNIGIPLYEGYGCTETSPVLAANFPGNRKVGTVGKPFPGVQIKIAEDGEILAKGPNVMTGYYKKQKETSEVIDEEGWYHTGDLGKLDAENYLTITGRKKELFKTVNGKYVSPVPIESALINQSKIVDMAMVVAEGRKYVTCLLFPELETIDTLKKSFGLEKLSNEDFVKADAVRKSLQETIDSVNSKLNHWEKIQKFTLSHLPVSAESGELTPSMKLRRHVVEKKFSGWIESMYAES